MLNIFIRITMVAFVVIGLTACGKSSKEIDLSVASQDKTDMNWYSEAAHKCKKDEGPDEMIKLAQTSKTEYHVVDEEKVGDVLVKVRLDFPSEGGHIVYYRGKDRCEANLKAKQNSQNKAEGINWEKEVSYVYFADGSCRTAAKTKCMNVEEYKYACDKNGGISKGAVRSFAFVSLSDDKKLIENGTFNNFKVSWGSSNRCDVSFSATGIIDGNSKISNFYGKAIGFSVDPETGQLLIQSVDAFH